MKLFTVAPGDTFGRTLWETVSNLAYPVAGLWTGEPVFAALMTGLGLASAYYHAGGRKGNHWDVGAIYAVLLFLILAVWHLPLIFIPLGAVPAAWWLRMKQLDVPMETKIGVLMATLLGFGAASALVLSTTSALLVFGLASGVLLVALVVRRWIDHGLWHLLSAYGLALCWYGVTLIRMAQGAALHP